MKKGLSCLEKFYKLSKSTGAYNPSLLGAEKCFFLIPLSNFSLKGHFQDISSSHQWKRPKIIGHFTAVCLVTWPLSGSKAGGDLVLIQTLLLFKCKSCCSHAN